jgi:hypothetical protein
MTPKRPHLEPCPLCGSEVHAFYNSDYYAEFEFGICCTNAHCRLTLPTDGLVEGGVVILRPETIEAWNRRVTK